MPKTKPITPTRRKSQTQAKTHRSSAPSPAPLKLPPPAHAVQVGLGYLTHGVNVRNFYKPQPIGELADSIKAKGLLQNLVGYYDETEGGEPLPVRISAGHRRLKGLHLLKEQGASDYSGRPFDDSYPVTVLIKPKTEALEDSLIENLQREEMTPLEEAQGFYQLRQQYAYSPEEIAERTGKPLAAVKKRLFLVDNLCEEGKALLEAEELTLIQAQALTALPLSEQPEFLQEHGCDFNARTLQWRLERQGMEVKHALFELESYLAQGGVIQEDLYGLVGSYFAHPELAKKLQLEAAQAKVEALKGQWAWAELVLGGFDYSQFQRSDESNRAIAGALVLVHPEHLAVRVAEGVVRCKEVKHHHKSQQQSSGESNPKPRNSISKSGIRLSKAKKTLALQDALVRHENAFKIALSVAVLGLLGEGRVRIGFAGLYEQGEKQIHPTVQTQFAQTTHDLAVGYTPSPNQRPSVAAYSSQTVLTQLLQQPLETLQQLFIALTATAVGTWVDFPGDNPNDDPLSLLLAQVVGARVEQSEMDEVWLRVLSKPRLLEIYAEVSGHRLVGDLTGKQLRSLILEHLKRVPKPDFLPQELSFFSSLTSKVEVSEPSEQLKVIEEDWASDEHQPFELEMGEAELLEDDLDDAA